MRPVLATREIAEINAPKIAQAKAKKWLGHNPRKKDEG